MSAHKITNANGFKAPTSLRLLAADPRVQEIEGSGPVPSGRVFVHLAPGFLFDGNRKTRSVESAEDIRNIMKTIKRTRP